MKRIKVTVLTALLVLVLCISAGIAEVRLPTIIGDNMVIQQGKPVAIWGWDGPGEKVFVSPSWEEQKWGSIADESGYWIVRFRSPQAGGPYQIKVEGSSTIDIKNILCGEVWVCSGQSNMAWSVSSSSNAKEEIARGAAMRGWIPK